MALWVFFILIATSYGGSVSVAKVSKPEPNFEVCASERDKVMAHPETIIPVGGDANQYTWLVSPCFALDTAELPQCQ